MKKNWLIILFFLTILRVNGQFRSETAYLNFEGFDRSYTLFVPEKYSTQTKYPLVFILHGGGGNAKGLEKTTRTRFNMLANRDGFIAVYLNGIGKSWNDGARDTFGVARKLKINDVGFIEKIIDELDQKFNIDRKNVFACGISNGGFMVQKLAFELSDKIRGIGVVAANLSKVQADKKFPGKPVPVIFINGTSDPLVPYFGGFVTVFHQQRGEVLSVEESLKTWQEINGCTLKKGVYPFPDKNKKDGSSATKTVWQNPAFEAIKVVAIKVENGGHTWPGTYQHLPRRLVGNTNYDFNGCDEIWDFFQSLISGKQASEK